MRGDKTTDGLYAGMRDRFGEASPLANGYRYRGYFLREQALLLSLLDSSAPVLVDVACGSGLMLAPLLGQRALVFGVDFNADACRAAAANGFPVVRGDAFALPLPDAAIDEITCCQFFNQQTPAAVASFVREAARVLRPGGRAVFVWRNAGAFVHRVAHFGLTAMDRLRGREVFPQYGHAFADVDRYAADAGLEVGTKLVSFPPLGWRSARVGGVLAGAIGASCVLVASRSAAPGGSA